ncbi:hypothetical protein GCM10011375_38880 [Hymenobacter qilianensis]|uniref:Uncharacterized protein n=2 Tax=Hymenobacter qilianensis TaxID=1385715 RepID=A0ACB5PWX5_9BACT|nr:hypothetical protein [Hymenobacter qilianensis]QNP54289.1 hypothetical protein H9L05_20885 [Hymenobacter qilianensis]GGF80052.1 hypothetical protein GCM10011375_38880 [Hymenobacter qilianensis]
MDLLLQEWYDDTQAWPCAACGPGGTPHRVQQVLHHYGHGLEELLLAQGRILEDGAKARLTLLVARLRGLVGRSRDRPGPHWVVFCPQGWPLGLVSGGGEGGKGESAIGRGKRGSVRYGFHP